MRSLSPWVLLCENRCARVATRLRPSGFAVREPPRLSATANSPLTKTECRDLG
jgi:hypothetical protein